MNFSINKKRHFGVLAVAAPLTLTVWAVSKVVTPLDTARAQGQTSGPLLLNGDFSQTSEGAEVPDHWQVQRERGSRARVSLEGTGARSSPAALRISVERGTVRVQQTLPNVPLAPAIVAGYAKAPTITQTLQGILQVFGATDDEPMLTLSLPIEHSSEWKEFSQRLLLPKGATRATLSFEVNGKGDVLLDDITIKPVSQGTGNSPNDTGPANG